MPTGPVTTPTSKEMVFPYPSRALGISFLTLAAVPAAVGRTRDLVRLGLDRWRLAPLVPDAELVVSELATNAIQAAGLTDTGATWNDAGNDVPTFHVRMLLFETSIIIEVWDADPAPPVPQHVTREEEGGRGLLIVAMIERRWDWFSAPQGGEVVWAELPIPPRPLTEAGLLPQRSRLGTVTRENRAGVIRDPVLLRRIHRALKNL